MEKRQELNLLYHFEEPVLLDKKFEFGLIYIAHKNKLFTEQKILFDKFVFINSIINKYDDIFINKLKSSLND